MPRRSAARHGGSADRRGVATRAPRSVARVPSGDGGGHWGGPELDAAAPRPAKALVARKRLYFAVLEADEATEKAPIPEKSAEVSPLATIAVDAATSPPPLRLLLRPKGNAPPTRRTSWRVCVWRLCIWRSWARGWRQRATHCSRRPREEGGDVFGLGTRRRRAAETTIGAKVDACVAARRAAPQLDARRDAVRERGGGDGGCARARSRLERDADKLPRPVAKTVERVGSKAKSARGIINVGVSKLREKPLSAAASAAEYTKGVWVRLNGGLDGVAAIDERIADLPAARSVAEARAARVLSLTVEVQDCDKALREASNERDKVMGQGKDSLSRVRLAKSIRERDDEVRDLRRVFATRTLQLEMERILAQLEEEACEVPSLETPDRADEVELLAAEFGAMDAGLKKLAWMVDTDNSAAIEDDDLTRARHGHPRPQVAAGVGGRGRVIVAVAECARRARRAARRASRWKKPRKAPSSWRAA